MTKLTKQDLEDALQDERHLGFGYAERQYLPAQRRARLDSMIVREANSLGWTAEDLFEWTNSKYGRWLCGSASDRSINSLDLENVVRAYVNDKALETLKAGM